jgi:hypothetical protein
MCRLIVDYNIPYVRRIIERNEKKITGHSCNLNKTAYFFQPPRPGRGGLFQKLQTILRSQNAGTAKTWGEIK